MGYLDVFCLVFKCLEIFLSSFYCWFHIQFQCSQRTHCDFNSFKLKFPGCDLHWWMFHGCFKKMYILLLSGKCSIYVNYNIYSLISWQCCLVIYLCWFYVSSISFLKVRSCSSQLWLWICPFSSIVFCFVYLRLCCLGYIHLEFFLGGWINPFIYVMSPFVSSNVFVVKHNLSDINIATPDFLNHFAFDLLMLLYLKLIFLDATELDHVFFLIYPANLYILLCVVRSLLFKIIIGIWELTYVILSFILSCLFLVPLFLLYYCELLACFFPDSVLIYLYSFEYITL